jgi:ABC-type branched-subunit amino acid transport system substrate-binding protein
VRLVALSSTRPEDEAWDPGTVEAGAERAADDPTAIAYVGEVERGASAVSLPVTNRAGLLQVSPSDGLTSLTTSPPGRPRAGPERYYPDKRRTFLRLVPSDLEVARAMLAELPPDSSRAVAIVHAEGVAERELAGMLAYRLRRGNREPLLVEPVGDDPGGRRALADQLAAKRVRAVLFATEEGAASRAMLADLARRLPSVPVVASPPLAAPGLRTAGGGQAITGLLPPREQPARARKLLRTLPAPEVEGAYAYDAMRLTLAAIDSAGPDRRRVVAAALEPGARGGVTGRFEVRRGGTVRGRPLAIVDLGSGEVSVTRRAR